MPRKGACLNKQTDSLIRAIDRAPGADLLERLSALTQDASLPMRMRLDACKLLSGALHGGIRLSTTAKEKIQTNFNRSADNAFNP
jgi:hypothetical protein